MNVQIFSNGKELINPVADPVIIRVALRHGNDTLNYLVPTATTLVRQVDISSGSGSDRIAFDDDVFNQFGENVDGLALNAGSNLVINFSGAGGGGDSFFAKFGEIQGSELTLNVNCGSGDDSVRILFHDADILGSNSIDFDSKVMVNVSLGGAGSVGNFCRVEAGEFTAAMGGNDIVGSSLDVFVQGGGDRDVVTFQLLYFTIGRFAATPTSIAFNASLGGGADYFFFLHDAQNVLHTNASVSVTANGGAGADRLIARKGNIFPGGVVTLDENALFEVNLFGDGGNDQVHAFFSSLSSTRFQIDANAIVRFRLNGGFGNDRVSATLENDNTIVTSPLGIYDVAVLGGPGMDRMALAIIDTVGLTYVGGKALLNGGPGFDTIERLIGVTKENVQKVRIP
jgi:hypothetical protein